MKTWQIAALGLGFIVVIALVSNFSKPKVVQAGASNSNNLFASFAALGVGLLSKNDKPQATSGTSQQVVAAQQNFEAASQVSIAQGSGYGDQAAVLSTLYPGLL